MASLISGVLFLTLGGRLGAGQYGQSFQAFTNGASHFGDGSVLTSTHLGTASATFFRTLAMTWKSTLGTRAAYMLPDLDPGQPVYAFSAKWNSIIQGDFPNAADGFSFNFGPLAGMDLVNIPGGQESGFNGGISFSVQTYQGNAPGFYVRVNGQIRAYIPFIPATYWGVNNGREHFFEVDWQYSQGLSVRVDGVLVLNQVPTFGYNPRAGDRFAWGARTGGLAEYFTLDNISVVTGGNLTTVPVGTPYFMNPTQGGIGAPFDGNLETSWHTFQPANVWAGATCVNGPRNVRAFAVGIPSGTFESWNPYNWSLEASDDNGASWQTLHREAFFLWTMAPELRAWTLPPGPAHKAYRLNVERSRASVGNVGTEFSEVRLYELTPFNPVAPAVGGSSVSEVFARTARATATVNSGGMPTVVRIDWGQTTNYGSVISLSPLAGGLTTNFSVNLGNLTPRTTYHLRVVAANLIGTNTGPDLTFATGEWTPVDVPGLPANLRVNASVWGDFNNDLLPDLLVAGEEWNVANRTLLFRNHGNGQFTNVPTPFPPLSDPAIAAGDFDNDGRLDVLFTGSTAGGLASATTQLWHNDGNGQFSPVSIPGVANVTAGAASWVDFNQDGRLDFLVSGIGMNGTATELWRNEGNRVFVRVNTPGVPGFNRGSASWADYDRDGFPDLLLTGNGTTRIWHNESGSALRPVVVPGLPGLSLSTACWGDIDSDGWPDVLLSSRNFAGAWRNQGDGTFAAINGLGWQGGDLGVLGVVDLDNDGRAEILNFNDYFSTPNAAILYHRGTNGYVTQGLPAGYYPGASWADYDGDGRVDLFVGSLGASRLWHNECPQTNQPPSSLYGYFTPVGGTNTVTITWPAASDSATPAAALTYDVRIGTLPHLGDAVWPNHYAGGVPQRFAAGNAGNRLSTTLALPPGTYHAAVQAVDGASLGGGYSVTYSFTVRGAPPEVTTLPTAELLPVQVKLGGTLSPVSTPTLYWIEYGATTNYGSRTPTKNPGSSPVTRTFTERLAVTPLATYHYRFVASNSLGVVAGQDRVFTTPGDERSIDAGWPYQSVAGTSPNSPVSQGVTEGVDNSAETKYLNFDKFGAGLTLVPYFTNHPVRGLSLISGEDASERDPASFVVEGSLNGTAFVQIASNAIPPFPARRSIQSFTFSNATAYPVYRVTFPTVRDAAAANSMQVAEVELLAWPEIGSTNDLVTARVQATVVTAPARLGDRRLMSDADQFALEGNRSNVVVEITPAAGVTVLKGVQLISGNRTGDSPNRHSPAFSIEGSLNGTNYQSLGSMALTASPRNLELEEFALPANLAGYRHYRFVFTQPAGSAQWELGELRLFGLPDGPPPALTHQRIGGSVQLRWPASAAGYTLEQRGGLFTGSWTPVTNAPVASGGIHSVTVTASGPASFFRLRR